jgi:CDP-diacylglycerol--glycerol-3-phosphate 3-phosphatidyltransferase
MQTNIANIITCIRILLIPLFIGLFLLDKLPVATIIFSVAALTDGLDGYLARHFHQTSPLGAWLDPVADKLMVISTLILLLSEKQLHHLTIPTVIIICREVMVSSLREWMATLGKKDAVKVSFLGKWKTTFQMLALYLFLLSKLYPAWTFILLAAYTVFYIATLLTFVSFMDYLYGAWKATSEKSTHAIF